MARPSHRLDDRVARAPVWALGLALVACSGASPPPATSPPATSRPEADPAPEAAPDDEVRPTGFGALDMTSGHGCVAHHDGWVSCWGDGRNGVSGDHGERGPRRVEGIDDAVDVAVGQTHACALRADRTVVCWGSDGAGELGRGAPVDGAVDLTAAPVAGLGAVAGLAVGPGVSCAIDQGHALRCWGRLHPRAPRTDRPVAIEGLGADVVDVDVASDSVCAIQAGRLVCWQTSSNVDVGPEPGRVALATRDWGEDFEEVALGSAVSCLRRAGGAVSCWGAPARGRPSYVATEQLTLPTEAVSLAAGNQHACAVGADRRAYCWGDGQTGALGDGALHVAEEPSVMRLEDVDAVALGWRSGCALAGGALHCFGSDDGGRLPTGSGSWREEFEPVPDVTDVVRLVHAARAVCAIHHDGAVTCWGGGYRSPRRIAGVSGPSAVRVSDNHACGILGDRTMRCWGRAAWGALGHGSTDAVEGAVDPGLTDVEEVHVGHSWTAARDARGAVWIWGDIPDGLLGRRGLEPTTRPTPTRVEGVSGATGLAINGVDACALLAGGRVTCWGAHRSRGRRCHPGAGDGTVCDGPPSPRPRRLSNVRGVTGIRTQSSTIELLVGGTLRWRVGFEPRPIGDVERTGFGARYRQRVGAQALNAYPSPAPRRPEIAGPPGQRGLVAGDDFACAWLQDGTVACAGDNRSGQLGTETPHPAIPTPVSEARLRGEG